MQPAGWKASSLPRKEVTQTGGWDKIVQPAAERHPRCGRDDFQRETRELIANVHAEQQARLETYFHAGSEREHRFDFVRTSEPGVLHQRTVGGLVAGRAIDLQA